MPFKLPFKRTRRYDISSKNMYMVEVHMLDNSFLECTLTSDSTGHECLDGIAQKIELQEIHYFGLRYVTKKLQFRWVDLSKPLKKQLEKHAQSHDSHASTRSPRLYFGVMFYIANAHKIVDDVARYQYYLQLKADIVDGRLPLTVDQVIRLAAYSLQVEFNDYESDRPAIDYFTDNVVFPKTMTRDENIMTDLTNEVLQAYMRLVGLHPVKAEIRYMKEIQMMDGYGMEYYVAKDERGKELYLGTSYIGIFERYLDGQPPVFYKWTEISKLQQSKKTFEVDTNVSKGSVQYTMEDSDTSKYLKRMCLLQQKFYKSSRSLLSASLSDDADFPDPDMLPDIQPSAISQSDLSQDQLNESQTSLSSLRYSDHPKYEQDSRSASIATDDYYTQSQQSLNVSGQDLSSVSHQVDHHPERPPSTSSSQYSQQQQHHHYQQHQQQYHHHQHPQQQQQQQHQQQMSRTDDPTMDPNYASRLAALPAYRQTPDYATVMKMKMNAQMSQMQNNPVHDMNQNIANTHIYAQSEEGLAYSQPEIGGHSHTVSSYTSHNHHYQMETPIRNYGHSMYTNVFQEQSEYIQYRVGERQSNLVMQPTYSSPELNTQGLPQGYTQDSYVNVNDSYMYHYKPPPPYPRGSNSTPDLAAQTHRANISDSPDLVSRKFIGNNVVENQSQIDKSAENVAKTIPEVVQISQTTVETETGLTEVQASPAEPDDASSDHSNSTFHVKETDSEAEDSLARATPHRQSSKSKITVRFVAPNKVPPPSISRDVVTRRESFHRMMIARSGSFTPGVLREHSKREMINNRSLREKNKHSIEEYIREANKALLKTQHAQKQKVEGDPVKENVKNVLEKVTKHVIVSGSDNIEPVDSKSQQVSGKEVARSQSDANKPTKVAIVHEKAVSLDSSSERQQILERLKNVEPELPSTIEENDRSSSTNRLVDYEDSDSDQEDTTNAPIGPLKMAAMNGLAMSRPMVLALMNDETRAPKDERRKILEKKLEQNLVYKEFEQTPKKIAEFDCSVAKLADNERRNRFRDVLPYDCTRVKLNPRKDNSSGYINGSHIKLSVGNRVWWYIATQAPMDNTPADFWQMIWEQEVEVVAMLTALAEQGHPKCYPYWPQDPGAESKLVFGDYEVTLLFTNDSLCYITNRILLRHLPSKKQKQVWHLQYTDWPDHGCPDDMYGFLGFLDEVESVQRLAESEEGSGKKSPIVVHCSAGVGRTGVVILTQVMKWCLEHNQEIDLPKALALIRQQRMYMVQTLGQYNFIHKTLIQYLKNTRLI